jgi:hypothetical protein
MIEGAKIYAYTGLIEVVSVDERDRKHLIEALNLACAISRKHYKSLRSENVTGKPRDTD